MNREQLSERLATWTMYVLFTCLAITVLIISSAVALRIGMVIVGA